MISNEYTSIQQFYKEYCKGKCLSYNDSEGIERFMGIEFLYDNNYYRMCREPLEDDERPILANGQLGYYNVTKLFCTPYGYPCIDHFESLGWYSTLDDLLENCCIDGEKFANIIISPSTIILSKD